MSAPNWMVLEVYANGVDEPTTVEIKPRTVLQWERAYKSRSAIQLDNDALKLTYLYELAWLALGKPGGDFTAWADTTDVTRQQSGAEQTPDPTNVAVPTDS